jgi:FHA domain
MLVSVVMLALAVLCAAVGVWAIRRSTPSQAMAAAFGPSPAEPALAVLEFEGPPGRVTVERAEVVIGRHSEDDVRISDVRVSRHHARLVARHDGKFEIHNLTADRTEPNPMQVNGETREHADIADGDVVSLGGVSFTFRRAA